MTKVRPCKQSITSVVEADADCPYPAMKGKQSCVWHWLMKQSADVQGEHRDRRLAVWLDGKEERRARVPEKEWPDGERWCAGCQSFIPLFYCSGSRCKSCNSTAAHGRRVEETYGVTPARYKALLEQQGGRCAICRCLPRTMRLAVDHDHKTGAPRGLLCKRCNHDLLGGGHDDPMLLWKAVSYLIFPPASYPDRSLISDAAIWGAIMDLRSQDLGKLVTRSLADDPAPF